MHGCSNGDIDGRQKRVTPSFSIDDIGKLLSLNCSERPRIIDCSVQLQHRRFKRGGAIYRQGQLFDSLYVVRFGFLKAVLRDIEGTERVLSFPMKGNLLGFDGIWADRYSSEALALTDCELIVIPFKQFLSARYPCGELVRMVYSAISREFSEEHASTSMSSQLKAEARVARFLAELAKRYAALGYSCKEILLPMTRRDIGCYLGLSLETVSRSLSILSSNGVIEVRRKNVTILDTDMLQRFHYSTTRLKHSNRARSLVMHHRACAEND